MILNFRQKVSRGLEWRNFQHLPAYSWINAHGKDLVAVTEYEKSRIGNGKPRKSEIARLVGGEEVHVKITALVNGLSYATIVNDKIEIVHANCCYDGIELSQKGNLNTIVPKTKEVDFFKRIDLCDGFKIVAFQADNGMTMNTIQKKFGNGLETTVTYNIGTHDGHAISLFGFSYTTASVLQGKCQSSEITINGNDEAVFTMSVSEVGKNISSNVSVAFLFEQEGSLDNVILNAGEEKIYPPGHDEAKRLSKITFGEIEGKMLDAGNTLTDLIDCAKRGAAITLERALKFISPLRFEEEPE